jgi:hypothetical protein
LTGEGSNSQENDCTWKEIWSLKVPNPVKMFLWRACSDVLPTKANLLRRGVLQEVVCVLCNQEIESTRHVLWDCPTAQDVWCACDRIFQKSSFEGSGFREIWEALIMRCNQEELAFSAILARNIWFRRNSFVHGGVFSHPNKLVRDAEVSLHEFSHVKSMATSKKLWNYRRHICTVATFPCRYFQGELGCWF